MAEVTRVLVVNSNGQMSPLVLV